MNNPYLKSLMAVMMFLVIQGLGGIATAAAGLQNSITALAFTVILCGLAEMFGYVTALRTITSGRATSSMTYDHHAPVSSGIAKAVLEEIKGRVDLV